MDNATTLAELDALTGDLPAAAARVARRLDRVLSAKTTPGLVLVDGEVVCCWCLENAGWCTATGGINLCEGHDDHVVAAAETVEAPEVRRPFGGA